MDLTTAARVNARRGQDATLDETLIGTLITEVSDDVETYLQRHTQSTARTEVFELDYAQDDFRLTGYPVTNVSSVAVSVDLDFAASEILSASSYFLRSDVGRLHLIAPATAQPTYVQVNYTGGMAADTTAFVAAFPAIAGAVEAAVIEMLARADQPGVSETRLRDGGVTYQAAVNMLPLLRRRLDQHKRTVIL